MKVSELIELLQDMNPEAEVRLAYQPNYPLQAALGGVVAGTEMGGALEEDDECDVCGLFSTHDADCPKRGVDVVEQRVEEAEHVYLLEGDSTNHPYASARLWDQAGY